MCSPPNLPRLPSRYASEWSITTNSNDAYKFKGGVNKETFAIESGPKGSGVWPITTGLMAAATANWLLRMIQWMRRYTPTVQDEEE